VRANPVAVTLPHAPPAAAARPVALAAVPTTIGRPLRVVAADPADSTLAFYRTALGRLGHKVEVVRTGPELVEACRRLGPDLVLTARELPGLGGLMAAELVCDERPTAVVLVSDSYDASADVLGNEWVMAWLGRPVVEHALGAAVAVAASRFDQLLALRAEVADLKQALEDRKVIERAKGAVCRRTGLPEDEAYRRMRAAASSANRKLVDVARGVLEAETVFREFGTAPYQGGRS
jgi:AmiR/NasT family two-component response regulator